MIISTNTITGLFIVPLSIIGILTSYSDIRYGKIKNTHLFYGFIYAILLYLLLILYSIFAIDQPNNLKYILELFINGTVAIIFGYLLWYFNLWAAGDAKLFAIYSLLIPLENYSKNHIPQFPSLILLTDTFLLICFSLIIKILYKILLSCYVYLKKPFSLSHLASKKTFSTLKKPFFDSVKLLLFSSCFLIIMQFIMINTSFIQQLTLFGISLAFPLFFILQMLLMKTILKNKFLLLLTFFGGLFVGSSFLVSGQIILLLSILKMSIFFVLFFSIGMQLVHLYIDRVEFTRTKVITLIPGGFLTTESIKEIANKFKENKKSNSLDLICSDGLTKSQVETIKKLYKNDLDKEIYMYRTFPFAPYMFLAFIFTVLYKGSFLFFLLKSITSN